MKHQRLEWHPRLQHVNSKKREMSRRLLHCFTEYASFIRRMMKSSEEVAEAITTCPFVLEHSSLRDGLEPQPPIMQIADHTNRNVDGR